MVNGRVTNQRRTDSEPLRGLHSRLLLIAGATLVLAATLAFATLPAAGVSFRSPEVHAGIETASAMIAVLAASLIVGRYRAGGALRDLALLGALIALAIGNVAFSTVPALAGHDVTAFNVWAPVGGRLVAAMAFAAAAFLPDVRMGSPRRAAAVMLAAVALALALVAVAVGSGLPTDFGTASGGADVAFDAPAGFLAAQAVTMLLFAIAAAGFARRAAATRDELIAWFAAGTLLAAVSRLNILVFPAIDSDVVVTGDLLRLAAYLVLLAGALREIRRYQRRTAIAAVLDDRRRLARDLHDGLAQELAYMVMQARRMAGTGDERAAQVAVAAENALAESRQAIVALSRRPDEPLREAVAQVAGQLTSRAGTRLRLDIDSGIELDSDRRDQLLNIVREAVANGIRHGGANEVCVSLSNGDAVLLKVTDDGRGFDPEEPSGGFGLTSMRERAQALGGALDVSSRPGEGTEVRVKLR